jgi:Holliday junction resolvase
VSKYSDGYRLECAARDVLRDNGYEVIRSAGSKGAADLVCFKQGEALFVQAKKSAGQMTPGERGKLIRLSAMIGGVPLSARWVKVGSAARTVCFDELTGPGPKDFMPWDADYASEIPDHNGPGWGVL